MGIHFISQIICILNKHLEVLVKIRLRFVFLTVCLETSLIFLNMLLILIHFITKDLFIFQNIIIISLDLKLSNFY